jgi:hypothetical protein
MTAALNVYNTVKASRTVPVKQKAEWMAKNPAASALMGKILRLWKERDG